MYSAGAPFSQKYLKYHSHKLSYIKFGNPKGEPLIVFHGFGEQAQKYQCFAPTLGKKYKVIAVDLPHHGSTDWRGDKLFAKKEVVSVIKLLRQEEDIPDFSLMGYSLGGKVALACLEQFADDINTIFLLAPDGIKTNIWYDVTTYPRWGGPLLKTVLRYPRPLLKIVEGLYRLGIVRKSIFKFTAEHLETAAKRRLVYQTWKTFRQLEVNLPLVQQKINKHHISAHLFFGQYDRIIRPSIGQLFCQQISGNLCKLHVIDTGHDLITAELNPHFENILNAPA
jgi:pimeloyl-ACP methyl ester carboxylesterase